MGDKGALNLILTDRRGAYSKGRLLETGKGGGEGLIRGFTVVKCQQSTQTYLNQFHNIFGFVKANNIKVDLRECDWLGCGNCNEQV